MAGSWFGGRADGATSGSMDREFPHTQLQTSIHTNNNHFSRNKASPISMKDAVQVLYSQQRSIVLSGNGGSKSRTARSRFSTLLLDHGEKHVQDWAVIAYSSPLKHSSLGPRGGTLTTTSSRSTSKQSQGTKWAAQASLTDSATKTTKRRTGNRLSSNMATSSSSPAELTAESHPSAHLNKWEGRLHLCSKSLVLEPTDFSRGIIRIPFSKMPDGPPKEYPSRSELLKMSATGQAFETMGTEFQSTRHWIMRENGAIGPYESIHVSTQFRLTFLHSSPSTFVDLCQQLFLSLQSKNPLAVEKILKPMYDRPFDFQTNLLDVRERPLLQGGSTSGTNATSTSTSAGSVKCQWMQPLQNQAGCLVVTQERLYFQPTAGVLGVEYATPQSSSWLLHSQLLATARRYKGLTDSALELYWKDGTSTLFGFERKHDREQVLRLMPAYVPCHTDRGFLLQAFQAWQAKTITNLDYLLLLNSAAGRSFQDLSRYPVVPWVIKDYTSSKLDLKNPETFRDLSKPIGALNPERLEYFRQRYEGMHDTVDFPFLYGTHYSAAGYVLYYLVRSMPEHMLCLQNGKFDAPDRMFHSVYHTYNTLLKNHADLKELIPEFYNPNLNYDFLINAHGLQLGATQHGERVNDVTLPAWAKSPRDFIKKNAKALESDICSDMLPRWIDLIFGCKSRGDAAKEASNLFHRYAYMGPADLANLPTQDERYQAELHATEFGLVPDQLFVGPHPLKHETVDESFVSLDIGRTFSGSDELGGKGETWEVLDSPSHASSNEDGARANSGGPGEGMGTIVEASDVAMNSFGEKVDVPAALSGKRDDFFREAPHHHPPRDRSIPLSGSGTGDRSVSGSGAFSYLGKDPSLSITSTSSAMGGGGGSPRAMNVSATASEWDIKFIEKSRIHDDAVSGCSVVPFAGPNSSSLLVTTSLDGGMKVHSVVMGNQADATVDKSQYGGITSTLSRFSYIAMRGQSNTENRSTLSEFRSHTSRDPLACLAMASDGHGGKVAFAGGHDDVVLAYGINSGCAVASVYSHRDAVTGLNLLVRPSLMTTTAIWLEKATHIMISGSWDATVKVWSVSVANGETVSIDREPLAELFDADSSIVCVSSATIPDIGSIVIAAGCADGSFCVWTLHNDGVKVVVHKEKARRGSGPCSVLQWSAKPDGTVNLFAGFATGKVASFTLSDGVLKKASAASVGFAVQALCYSEGVLLIGCADGGLRLIPIRDGAYFTSDLSLWPAVHNPSSPGITSVGMSFMGNATDGSGRCVCCTGAADGSVALFELKKASPR